MARAKASIARSRCSCSRRSSPAAPPTSARPAAATSRRSRAAPDGRRSHPPAGPRRARALGAGGAGQRRRLDHVRRRADLADRHMGERGQGQQQAALAGGRVESPRTLPDERPGRREVKWVDGKKVDVEVLSARQAFDELVAAGTGDCADCEPIRITDANLATGLVETSTAARRRSRCGSSRSAGAVVRITRVAVDGSVTVDPPPWDAENPPVGLSIELAIGKPVAEARGPVRRRGRALRPRPRGRGGRIRPGGRGDRRRAAGSGRQRAVPARRGPPDREGHPRREPRRSRRPRGPAGPAGPQSEDAVDRDDRRFRALGLPRLPLDQLAALEPLLQLPHAPRGGQVNPDGHPDDRRRCRRSCTPGPTRARRCGPSC